MSIQTIEGDLYVGYSGNQISAVTGTSGLLCGSVKARRVDVRMALARAFFRNGLRADQIVGYNKPMPHQSRISIIPRDDTYADAMAVILRAAFGAATGGRSDFANGGKPGVLASAIQMVVRPVTGAAGLSLYAPAAVFIGDLNLVWSRRDTHTGLIEAAEFIPQPIDAASTKPSMMWDATATVQAAYF